MKVLAVANKALIFLRLFDHFFVKAFTILVRSIIILFLSALAVVSLHTPARAQCSTQTLVPDIDSLLHDGFATSIDIDGNFAVVGVPDASVSAHRSGKVLVYELKNDGWEVIATLLPTDSADQQAFGLQVAISGDIIAVAGNSNFEIYHSIGNLPVYIYVKPSSGKWKDATENQRLHGDGIPKAGFGQSLDMNDNELVVSGNNELFIYQRNGGSMVQTAKFAQSVERSYEGRVALSANTLAWVILTSVDQDYLYVYDRPPGGWTGNEKPAAMRASQNITNKVHFGNLAITDNLVVVNYQFSSWHGSVLKNEVGGLVYEKNGSRWSSSWETARLISTGEGYTTSMHSSAAAIDGDYIFLIRSGQNGLHIYKKPAGGWHTRQEDAIYTTTKWSGVYGYAMLVASGKLIIGSVPSHSQKRHARILQFKKPTTGWENLRDYELEVSNIQFGSDENFGGSIDVYGDYMVVGANGANVSAMRSGGAYVFHHDGKEWVKVARLSASDGNLADYLGTHVAINDNYIALSNTAIDSLDQNGNYVFHTVGAVYIYQKPAGGWMDATEDQKIWPPVIASAQGFGYAVDLSENTMAVSEYYTGSSESVGKVYVYTLYNSRWVLEATLMNNYATKGDEFGISLSIDDSTIVVGAARTIIANASKSNVYVYEKKGSEWKDAFQDVRLSPTNNKHGDLFGYDIHLHGEYLLVGAPGRDSTGTESSGRVYLYRRKGSSWTGEYEELQFHSSEGRAVDFLGASVYMNDTLIIAGARSGNSYAHSFEKDLGRAYIYRKKDQHWQSSYEDQIYFSNKPSFGYDVHLHEGKAIVGEYSDDNTVGYHSGSVHVLPIAYIEEAPDEACDYDALISLSGFPGGGAWSGVGSVSASGAAFDPVSAGAGAHKVRYAINSCSFSNHLIQVKGPLGRITDEQLVEFCQGDSVQIEMQAVDADYDWYYSQQKTDFEPIPGAEGQSVYASRSGFYRVEADNACYSIADTIEARSFALKIWPQDRVCLGDSVEIHASRQGGLWSRNGMQSGNGYFNSEHTGAGFHTVQYQMEGCSYAVDTTVWVITDPPEIPFVRSDRYICQNEPLVLQLGMSEFMHFDWMFASDGVNFQSLATDTSTIQLKETGTLVLKKYNKCGYNYDTAHIRTIHVEVPSDMDICREDEPVLFQGQPKGGYWYLDGKVQSPTVNPQNLHEGHHEMVYRYTIDGCIYTDTTQLKLIANPQPYIHDHAAQFCSTDPDFVLQAGSNDDSVSYEWFLATDKAFNFSEPTIAGPVFRPEVSGSIVLRANNSGCLGDTKPIHVVRTEPDSVFVPNIFTPNGDAYNQAFEVHAEHIEDYTLSIFDRRGKEYFRSQSPADQWEGHNASAGVYFWHIRYTDQCHGKQRNMRGMVHVMK